MVKFVYTGKANKAHHFLILLCVVFRIGFPDTRQCVQYTKNERLDAIYKQLIPVLHLLRKCFVERRHLKQLLTDARSQARTLVRKNTLGRRTIFFLLIMVIAYYILSFDQVSLEEKINQKLSRKKSQTVTPVAINIPAHHIDLIQIPA